MRPGELCQMRPGDIDRVGDVWTYRPKTHKNQSRGKQRLIAIGPRAQKILRPYLLRPADSFCFSPKEVVDRLMSERKANANTHKNYKARLEPKRSAGDAYTTESYRRVIHRA